MNNKNMIGNGSKATLPDGKKMEDYKKSPSYNSTTKTNSMNNAGNNDQNQQETNEEKPKSKGEQVAQNASSEVLVKSLKATFPYVPEFIIRKLVNSKIGQQIIEKQLKGVQKKITFGILGIACTALMWLFIIAMFFTLILSPVALVGEILEDIGNFFESLFNFVTGDGWNTDEEAQVAEQNEYYDELQKAIDNYEGDCVITEDLITSTVFYGQMVTDKKVDKEEDNANYYYFDFEDVEEGASVGDDATNKIGMLVQVYLIGEKFGEEVIKISNENNKEISEVYKKMLYSGGNQSNFSNPLTTLMQQGILPSIDINLYKINSDLEDLEPTKCSIAKEFYRDFLINYYIGSHYPSIIDKKNRTLEDIADEIIMMGGLDDYNPNGICSSSCSYTIGEDSISELKVQLLDNDGNKLAGEELITFEDYILGVTYGEIGPEAPIEAIKTEAIAARSYALNRGKVMNGQYGVKLEQVDSEWILYIRNSTNDQVYCNPDKGCGKRADGVFVSDSNNSEIDPNADYKPKQPLASNAPLRAAVSEVIGYVVLDKDGNILNTPYTNTQHNLWKEKANEGLDYTEILKNSYPDMVTIEEGNCSSLCKFAEGPYTEWKQYNWPDVYMNNLSLKDAGCLTVSVAMQIARSGVETPLGENFNPKTLVEKYKGKLYNGEDLWYWEGITKVIPSFKLNWNYSYTKMAGLSDEKQVEYLMKGLEAGCYYVVEVKEYKSGEHWVALDAIQDGVIYMLDPASNCKVLNECVADTGYKYRINEAKCYVVTK